MLVPDARQAAGEHCRRRHSLAFCGGSFVVPWNGRCSGGDPRISGRSQPSAVFHIAPLAAVFGSAMNHVDPPIPRPVLRTGCPTAAHGPPRVRGIGPRRRRILGVGPLGARAARERVERQVPPFVQTMGSRRKRSPGGEIIRLLAGNFPLKLRICSRYVLSALLGKVIALPGRLLDPIALESVRRLPPRTGVGRMCGDLRLRPLISLTPRA